MTARGPGLQALSPVEPLPADPSPFAALRHRNFQLYFGGQLVSNAGTWMQVIAQGWLVYQLTHSDLALGIVGFAAAIPSLLVTPWGGVVVDRVPKRALLIATQAGAMLLAFVLAALAFTGVVREWHIVLLAAALGFVNAFDAPGPAGICGRAGGALRPAQRNRAELADVQQRTRRRARSGRPAARGRGAGLVLHDQRLLVSCRHHRIGGDEARASPTVKLAQSTVDATRRRHPLCGW